MRGLSVIGLQWVQETEADEQVTCIHRRVVKGRALWDRGMGDADGG